MTLVIAWRERELSRVWLVTDSRLSSQGQAGRIQLTDNAAKLLVAPRVLWRQTSGSVFGTPVLQSAVGFAYAGSSLVALQAYAAVLPLWGHLQAIGAEVLPSMRAFAEHLGIFVLEYTRAVSAAHGALQRCQCAIIGYDHNLEDVDGWVVETRQAKESLQLVVRRMMIAPREIEILGSGEAAAKEALAAYPIDRTGLWERQPLAMIRAHLRQPPEDVGGGVQIGYANELGFELSYDVQAAEHGFYAMRYRGFEFDKVSRVGDAFCHLTGLL